MLVPVTEPSVEPISLEEARLQLNMTDDDPTDQDGLIVLMIGAARRYAESYTGRSFITQTLRQVLDGFPPCIELERGQVQQITSLTYRDMAGATQSVAWAAPSNYIQRSTDGTLVADLSGGVARITPSFGSTWPVCLPEIGAVSIAYTAGYGSEASDVPHGIRQWMLLRVATLFNCREEHAPGTVTPMPFLDGLLDPYMVVLA